jgi:S1-C subfamily serine protease
VVEVIGNSPAGRAGIRSEDLILDIDGIPVRGMDDLQRLMDGSAIDRAIPMRVYRNGATQEITVIPTELSA